MSTLLRKSKPAYRGMKRSLPVISNVKGVNLVRRTAIFLGISALLLVIGCNNEPRIPVERKPAAKKVKEKTTKPSPIESARYAYNIMKQDTPKRMQAGSEDRIRIKIRNTSNRTWEKEGSVKIGHYWTDSEGARLKGAEGRMLIRKEDIKPNEFIAARPKVSAPESPGEYILIWDMIEEGAGWFASKGAKPLRVPVTVF